MKKYILLTLAAIMSIALNAQYTTLINENNTWKGQTFGWITTDFWQKTIGDSIIGGVTYKKIYSGSTYENLDYQIGLIREEPVDKKVYIWTGEGEHLLYDFDVVANDAVSSWGVGMEQNITVTSVDIAMVGGVERIKVNFEDAWGPAYWIEGVGSVYGLIDAVLGPVADYGPVLQCFYEGNDLAWNNQLSSVSCDLMLSTSEKEVAKVSVWPNPFNETISLQLHGVGLNGTMEAMVYSPTGALVRQQKISTLQRSIEGLHDLPAGIYTLSILLDDKQVVSERILKLPVE